MEVFEFYLYKLSVKLNQSALRSKNVIERMTYLDTKRMKETIKRSDNYPMCTGINRDVIILDYSKIKCIPPFLAIRNMGKAMKPPFNLSKERYLERYTDKFITNKLCSKTNYKPL